MPYVKSGNYDAVAELLKQVRKSATMQKADFPDDLKERTRSWREAWLIEPLHRITKLLEMEEKKWK